MSNENWIAEGNLVEAATGLVRAIQAAPQWEEFQSARAAFEADSGLAALLARLRQLSASWRLAKNAGRGLVGKDASDLAELQGRIQVHPLFVRQQNAIRSVVAMFQQVNQVVSAELGLDFAANAATQGGGCCG